MAVNSDDVFRVSYNGDGIVKTFPITFEVPVDSLGNALFVQAVLTEQTEIGEEDTDLVAGVDYNIVGKNLITIADDAIPSTSRITIYRQMDLLQQINFTTLSTLDLRTLEFALDKLTFIAQQLKDESNRAITVPVSDESTQLELPTKGARANNFLAFGEDGEPIAAALTEIGAVSSYFKTIVDAISQADLQGRLDIEPRQRVARVLCRDVYGKDAVILRGLVATKGVGNTIDISSGVAAVKHFDSDTYEIVDVPAIENWSPGTAITDDTTRNYIKIRIDESGWARRLDQTPDVSSDAYLASFISTGGDFPALFSTAERGGENTLTGSAQRVDLGVRPTSPCYVLLAQTEDSPTHMISSSGMLYSKSIDASGSGPQFTAKYAATRRADERSCRNGGCHKCGRVHRVSLSHPDS
jgi:hypothetical protein